MDLQDSIQAIAQKIQRIVFSVNSFSIITSKLNSSPINIKTKRIDHDSQLGNIMFKKYKSLQIKLEDLQLHESNLTNKRKDLMDQLNSLSSRKASAQSVLANKLNPIDEDECHEEYYDNSLSAPEQKIDFDETTSISSIKEFEQADLSRKASINRRLQEVKTEIAEIEACQFSMTIPNLQLEEKRKEARQRKLAEEEKAISSLISKNQEMCKQRELSYSKKVEKIQALQQTINEIDAMVLKIHEESELILVDSDMLDKIEAEKRRILREKKHNIDKTKHLLGINQSVVEADDSLKKREESLEANSKLLAFRHNALVKQWKELEDETQKAEEYETRIQSIESERRSLESQINDLTVITKQEEDSLNELLLEASNERADSRLQKLQEMLFSQSDISQEAIFPAPVFESSFNGNDETEDFSAIDSFL